MTNKTLNQQSEINKCIWTLNSVKLNTKMLVENLIIDKDAFYSLVFLTPTQENRYGIKFKHIKKINKRTTDNFLRCMFERIGISDDSIMVFKTFNGKNKNMIETKEFSIKSNKPMILLKNEGNIVNSFFVSVRNCLAHGNIIKDSKWYYLFALSTKNNKISDEDKRLKFLLKIKDISAISAICDVLNEYK